MSKQPILKNSETAGPVDLVILSGQSNMEGFRSNVGKILPARRVCPGASIWYNKVWAPLEVGSGYQRKGAGPEVGFAQAWTQTTGKPLHIVKVCEGGASIWREYHPHLPGRKFSELLRETGNAFTSQPHRLVGLVWFQGEEDAKRSERAEAYQQRFSEFLTVFRGEIGAPNLPVVCAKLSTTNPKFPYVASVNAAFEAMEAENVATIDSADFPKRDGIHFAYCGLFELGRRAANSLYQQQRQDE